jgi:hypothetical protein
MMRFLPYYDYDRSPIIYDGAARCQDDLFERECLFDGIGMELRPIAEVAGSHQTYRTTPLPA